MIERFLRMSARHCQVAKLIQHLRNRTGYLDVIIYDKNSTGARWGRLTFQIHTFYRTMTVWLIRRP